MVRQVLGGKGVGKTASMGVQVSGRKMEKHMIQPYGKGKEVKVMVWGAFWGGGVGSLQIGPRFRGKEDGVLREFIFGIIER